MSSKRKITPTSGKSAYIDSGELNSYQDIATKRTQQDAINEGKEFKRSVYKTPWGTDADYQGMEFIVSPRSFQPIKISLQNINPDGIPDNFRLPTTEEEKEKEPCDCPDCMNLPTILQEVCCDGFSKVPVGFFVIGKLRNRPEVDESAGDGVEFIQAQSLPIPNNCSEKSIPCYTNIYTLWIDCSGSWTERQANLNMCGKDFPINVKKTCGSCSSLVIVDADGTPATDTILTNGSNAYAATGCSGQITWSASGTGASISSSGVLSASGSACGSLLVTATCASCGTSSTQYVRVTNSGQWTLSESCDIGGGCPPICYGCNSCTGCCGDSTTCEYYSGRYKYTILWKVLYGCSGITDECTTYGYSLCISLNCSAGNLIAASSWKYEWQCP